MRALPPGCQNTCLTSCILMITCLSALLRRVRPHQDARNASAPLLHSLLEPSSKSGNAAERDPDRRIAVRLQHSEATIGLAEVWLALGRQHAMRALHEVHTALPSVLAEGTGSLRARAHRLCAECLMVSASSQDLPDRASE